LIKSKIYNMKEIILTLGLFFLTNVSFAQVNDKNVSGNNPKFVYCEMVGTQKLFSLKCNIVIDFGENVSIWKDQRIKDEVTGKAETFNSMVDGLNYMGEKGWEFAQAYVVTLGQNNVYHWLLKKKIDD